MRQVSYSTTFNESKYFQNFNNAIIYWPEYILGRREVKIIMVLCTLFSNRKCHQQFFLRKCLWLFPFRKCVPKIIKTSNGKGIIQYHVILDHIYSIIV